MFTMEDLFPKYEGAKIKILDMDFTLRKDNELCGDLATWYNDSLIIHATPMFDNISLPVDVMTKDWIMLDYKCDFKEIFSFEEYKEKVKELTEKILEGL